jgi:hypothetical protein
MENGEWKMNDTFEFQQLMDFSRFKEIGPTLSAKSPFIQKTQTAVVQSWVDLQISQHSADQINCTILQGGNP